MARPAERGDPIVRARRAALRAGLSLDAFWSTTPHELTLVIDAAADTASDGYRLVLYGAWHGEAFARTKRMPRLDKLLRQIGVRQAGRRPITREEAPAFLKALNAAFGGIDKRKRQTTTEDVTDG